MTDLVVYPVKVEEPVLSSDSLYAYGVVLDRSKVSLILSSNLIIHLPTGQRLEGFYGGLSMLVHALGIEAYTLVTPTDGVIEHQLHWYPETAYETLNSKCEEISFTWFKPGFWSMDDGERQALPENAHILAFATSLVTFDEGIPTILGTNDPWMLLLRFGMGMLNIESNDPEIARYYYTQELLKLSGLVFTTMQEQHQSSSQGQSWAKLGYYSEKHLVR